jgi:hypothetical protein
VVRHALGVTSDVTPGDLRRQSWVLLIAGSVVAVVLVVVATAHRKATQAEA